MSDAKATGGFDELGRVRNLNHYIETGIRDLIRETTGLRDRLEILFRGSPLMETVAAILYGLERIAEHRTDQCRLVIDMQRAAGTLDEWFRLSQGGGDGTEVIPNG